MSNKCNFRIYPKCCTHTLRGYKYVLKKKKARILKITDNTKPNFSHSNVLALHSNPPTQNVINGSAGWFFFYSSV